MHKKHKKQQNKKKPYVKPSIVMEQEMFIGFCKVPGPGVTCEDRCGRS